MSKRPNTLKKLLYGRSNWCPNVQLSNFSLFWTIGRWTLTSITKKVVVIDYKVKSVISVDIVDIFHTFHTSYTFYTWYEFILLRGHLIFYLVDNIYFEDSTKMVDELKKTVHKTKYNKGNKMSNITKNTENNTMVYLVVNNTADTNHKDEDLSMDFDTSIVLFSMYPRMVKEGDTAVPMEHGRILLEIASSIPNKNECTAIALVVVTVAYLLNIDELVREAFTLVSDDAGIIKQFYAEMGPVGDDASGHYEAIDQLLELLGIDSNKKKRAINEISNMV